MSFMWSPATTLTLSTMITSTLMALSSTNWVFLWASMELNLLSFIPILMMSKLNQEVEASIKYFLAQALGSALLLTSSIMMWSPYSILPSLMPMILMISVLLKLGSAPCHFWYPSVMSSISWISCTILSSWQKLAPLAILVFFTSQMSKSLIMLMAGLNAMLGGIMGMNQSQLRTIMAYSSIGHLGWMLSFMLLDKPMMSMLYFTIYCSLIIPLFMFFNIMNFTTSKQLSKITMISPSSQMFISTLLISLAGLPPLTGFMPKMLAIMMLANYNTPLIIILILGSLMNLFFYLNIIINMMMPSQNMNTNLTKYVHATPSLMLLSSVTSMGLAPMIML
uniref:NADH-ubiquinone oxidoreductase chain 2 n=1 Tax=Amynthas hupeiensis TaxID=408830 RepID=A0A142AFU5_9ANNE|nr:NADH dehydrogenase subunit 2 [Amynthas hupeiensis]AMO26956.1 NADH dehydrogenase subunit 2 [Amynthas hupeiensis]BDQ43719.1 NADH dehydrogenase subunit 2 [Amynthas hupeiensis]BDQ43732.1 NADH dehydrogenase subunit 2 [Amynthas hupeiensis]